MCRSRRSSKGDHFERRFRREGGVAHQPLLVSEYQSDCHFVWYQISAVRHLVLSQSMRVTDRRTDGRTETTPKTALAYARAVKIVECWSYSRTASPMRQVCMKSAPRGIRDGTGSLLLSGNDTQNGRGFGGTPGMSRSHAVSAAGSCCDDISSAVQSPPLRSRSHD